MRRIVLMGVTATVALGFAMGQAGAGDNTVKAVNFDFKPKRIVVQKGQRVTWKNREGRHTVTARKGKFDEVISGNERVSRRFKKRGKWRYICRFHLAQGMTGRVIVR